MEGKNKADC